MSAEQRFRDVHRISDPEPESFQRAWAGERGLVWLLLARGGSALIIGLVLLAILMR